MQSEVKPAREGIDTCLYIPGKVEGRPLHYLLDTGCSGNVLSKAMFSRLPASIQESLHVERTSAFMADGSDLVIYGTVILQCRIRTVHVPITFQVANTTDDAILGLEFFN